jgi:hypothetical protein
MRCPNACNKYSVSARPIVTGETPMLLYSPGTAGVPPALFHLGPQASRLPCFTWDRRRPACPVFSGTAGVPPALFYPVYLWANYVPPALFFPFLYGRTHKFAPTEIFQSLPITANIPTGNAAGEKMFSIFRLLGYG